MCNVYMHHQLHFKARLYIYLHVPVELNLKHVTSIVWYVRIYTATQIFFMYKYSIVCDTVFVLKSGITTIPQLSFVFQIVTLVYTCMY